MWKTLVLIAFAVGVPICALDDFNEYSVEEKLHYIYEKCWKTEVVTAEQFLEWMVAILNSTQCIDKLFTMRKALREIATANLNGTAEDVIDKYCQRIPQIKICYENRLNAASHCLNETERFSMRELYNRKYALMDYACDMNGSRVKMFFKEGGMECLRSQSEAIRGCSANFRSQIKPYQTNMNHSASTDITKAIRCAAYQEKSHCIGSAVEGCPSATPRNIVESFYRYVQELFHCEFETSNRTNTNDQWK